ncbi:hypothetical protein K0M31_016254 [Melipona bicolor]|uniref:Uncharacterized protein n=1 Tax=Melipona bicolor TaxID=60889 RepID=A0AA40KTB8_9HYME|nr:hypothetical protein K0M31_016254 [Melipona bicolor]
MFMTIDYHGRVMAAQRKADDVRMYIAKKKAKIEEPEVSPSDLKRCRSSSVRPRFGTPLIGMPPTENSNTPSNCLPTVVLCFSLKFRSLPTWRKRTPSRSLWFVQNV